MARDVTVDSSQGIDDQDELDAMNAYGDKVIANGGTFVYKINGGAAIVPRPRTIIKS